MPIFIISITWHTSVQNLIFVCSIISLTFYSYFIDLNLKFDFTDDIEVGLVRKERKKFTEPYLSTLRKS